MQDHANAAQPSGGGRIPGANPYRSGASAVQNPAAPYTPPVKADAGGGAAPRSSSTLWIVLSASLVGLVLLIVILVSATSSRSSNYGYTYTAPSDSYDYSAPSDSARSQDPPAASTPQPYAATPQPYAAAPTDAPRSGPGSHDMRGHDSRIVEPSSSAWLANYETRYVQSTGGVGIYLLFGPSSDYEYFDTVRESEAVTVLAEQNGFSLIIASGDRLGWCKSSLIVPYGERIAPVPSLPETCWIYTQDRSAGLVYATRFHGNGWYSEYRMDGETYYEGNYSLSGRQLKYDGVKFVWDGNRFVSSETYSTSAGAGHYYLTPDPDAAYDEIDARMQSITPPGRQDNGGNEERPLENGSYYVELTLEEYWGDHDFITFDLLYVAGVAPSENLIFQKTGQSYCMPISNSCVIWDSSVFGDDGLTEEYYSTIGPLIQKYGYGMILEIVVYDGEIVSIEKFYIA